MLAEKSLFDALGFNAVFYSSDISGPDMPNLMYMTTFKDQASREAHWKSFSDSPVWKNFLPFQNIRIMFPMQILHFYTLLIILIIDF